MKVSCPNCHKVLQAPDDWVGKKVKCPSCKRPITLPASIAEHDDLSFNLGSLDAMEDEGETLMVQRRRGRKMTLKEAQQADGTATRQASADPRVRTCPKCGEVVHNDDIYIDMICRHCDGVIPGVEVANKERARYTSDMAGRMTTQVGFYTGFTSAALYPVSALDSVLKAAGIALGVIAIPLLAVLAFTQSSQLNELSRKPGDESPAWVGLSLGIAFLVEAVYFGAVAYFVLIDTIRTTTAGREKPANLTWNIVNLGTALAGYAALLVFYGLILVALVGGIPTSLEQIESICSSPWKLAVLALLTFGVPMNIIGLSSSHALEGLNPVRVFPSIVKVLGQYIFLFLIVLLYLGLYAGLMWAIMSWAGPAIMTATTSGLAAGLAKMLMGIVAWAALIGIGFYFAYSIGRILGLFSRTYRNELKFDV